MKIRINAHNLSQMVQVNGPAPDNVEIIIDETLENGWFSVDDGPLVYLGDTYTEFVEI